MVGAHQITADALCAWATEQATAGDLPWLLRSLIRLTVGSEAKIEFSTGSGIYLSDFDGIVDATGRGRVPGGQSVWEVSIRRDVCGKAEEDYRKRSAGDGVTDYTNVVYVGVSLRRFAGTKSKQQWIEEKCNEGIWKDVRFLDAEDISEWLDQHAVIGFQLAVKLKRATSTRSLSDWWDDWIAPCSTRIGDDWLLSGRDRESDLLHSMIHRERQNLIITGGSQTESLAFIYSSIKQLPKNVGESILCRSLYIPSLAAFEEAAAVVRDAILLPMCNLDGHHIGLVDPSNRIIYCGYPIRSSDYLSLPKIRASILHDRMIRDGVEAEIASKATRAARTGVELMRKELGAPPHPFDLSGADPATTHILVALLLANRWSADNSFDKEVVTKMAMTTTERVESMLSSLASRQPPLIRRSGHVWFITDDSLAWGQLGGSIPDSVLEQFLSLSVMVLTENDPSFELATEDRWKAGVLGKSSDYSYHLKTGLARTLAVLAECKEAIGSCLSGQELVNQVVNRCLRDASDGRWYALAPSLSLLAEASPSQFLTALETDLGRAEPTVFGAYEKIEQSVTGGSRHSQVLWAIERLCWSRDYLLRASQCLCVLHEKGFGGDSGNTPLSSLRNVFLPWHPCTEASLSERIRVLDILRLRHPEAFWALLMELLPKDHSVAHPTDRPDFRDWGETPKPQLVVDVVEFDNTVIGWAILEAASDAARLAGLSRAFAGYPDQWLNPLLNHLSEIKDKIQDPQRRSLIWDAMRDSYSHHRQFPEVTWAMSEDQCSRYASVMQIFDPLDAVSRSIWLFDQCVNLPEPERDYEQKYQKIEHERLAAVASVTFEEGSEGVLRLAERVKEPGLVGAVAAKLGIWRAPDETTFFRQYIASPIAWEQMLARGAALGRVAEEGQIWIEKMLALGTWKAEQRVEFLIILPNKRETWSRVDEEPPEVSDLYWNRVSAWTAVVEEESDYIEFARHLFDASREIDILRWLASQSYSSSSEVRENLMVESLNFLCTRSNFEPEQLSRIAHDIQRSLEVLTESSSVHHDLLAQFEFIFTPILRFQYRPKFIEKTISSDPNFFLYLVRLLSNRYSEEPSDATVERGAMARLAYEVLDNWRTLPGEDDGRIETTRLLTWLEEVQRLASDENELRLAEVYIGNVFATAPLGEDGVWPPEAVCEVIEQTASDNLDEHVRVGRYNTRGVTMRGMHDGGDLERMEQARYNLYAQSRQHSPRVLRILNDLAESYARDASMEDQSAAMQQDL